MDTQVEHQVGMEQYILAIDLGTSGPKVALYTPAGELLDSVFEKIGLILLPGGGVEQAPADWRSAIRRSLQRLLERRPQAARAVIGISCTSQWSGTVAVDRDGRPLMNAIIWMDARGAPYAQQVIGGLFQVDGFRLDKLATWVRISGGIPSPAGKEPTAHILYIKNERPDIYRQAYKFLEPKDYLNLWLTGQPAASYDSIALHWLTDIRDLRCMDYHPKLLRMAGIERDKLPELKSTVDVLGPLSLAAAQELGLPAGVPVVMGTPDIHSAALGAGAVADGQAYLYIGTSNWIACHVPYKKTDVLSRMASLPSAIPNRYILSNEQQLAGGCIGCLWTNLFGPQDELACPEAPPDVYMVFERLAESVAPGSDGLIFTPWLNGERTPIDDRLARGPLHSSFSSARCQTWNLSPPN